jgi:hypothetical protein
MQSKSTKRIQLSNMLYILRNALLLFINYRFTSCITVITTVSIFPFDSIIHLTCTLIYVICAIRALERSREIINVIFRKLNT